MLFAMLTVLFASLVVRFRVAGVLPFPVTPTLYSTFGNNTATVPFVLFPR